MSYSLDAILLGAALPERIATRIQILVGAAPAPEMAARFLERLRQESSSAFDRIVSSPAALRCAVNLFSYSSFLSEAVLRNPERLLQVANSSSFYRVRTAEEYEREPGRFPGRRSSGGAFGGGPGALPAPPAAAHRAARRARHGVALRRHRGAFQPGRRHSRRRPTAASARDFVAQSRRAAPAGRAAVRLLGDLARQAGRQRAELQLRYRPDVRLRRQRRDRRAASPVTNKEFYKKVANQYTALLSTYTAEGQCYRVDLRLRPDGTLGEICISARRRAPRTTAERARDWEKQMLIKARVSAGEPEPGAALLEFVEPLIYQSSLDFRAVEAVSETRQRISEKAAAQAAGRAGGVDIKLTPGGIRDIEFLVQCLQRLHGGREPWVRHGGTMFALFRLRDKGLLSDAEYARLATAYQFLRYVEHRLQMEEDRQTHTLPDRSGSARPAGAQDARRRPAAPWTAETLQLRLDEHLPAVQEIYERVIHAQRPLYYASTEPEAGRGRGRGQPAAAEQSDALPRRARAAAGGARWRTPICTAGGSVSSIFWRRRSPRPTLLARLESRCEARRRRARHLRAQPVLRRRAAALSGTARRNRRAVLPGRRPADRTAPRCAASTGARCCASRARAFSAAADLRHAGEDLGAGRQRDRGGLPRSPWREAPAARRSCLPAQRPDDGDRARAVWACASSTWARMPTWFSSFRTPMPREHAFWTGVAERMIQIVSAYTGEGVMFTVDTRLRAQRPRRRPGANGRRVQELTSPTTPRPGKASPT